MRLTRSTRWGSFKKTPAAGFSLIESLVSVLILSIAAMGVAMLQASSLKVSQSSMDQTQASIYVYSIIDAMRTDVAAAAAGGYNSGGMACEAYGVGLAASNINYWFNSVGTAMKSPCLNITCDAAALCTVQVQWDNGRSVRETGSTDSVTVVALL